MFSIPYRYARITGQNLILNCCSTIFLLLAADILKDAVHLLQRPTIGLWDEQIRPNKGEETENSEEDIRPVIRVLNERWCDESLGLS